MVLITALLTPILSTNTLVSGAKQLVVQEAIEITWSLTCNSASFTLKTIVLVDSSLAGALIITFLAPACTWANASSPLVKRPVDSMTTSIPNLLQGNLLGSFSAKAK